MFFLLFLPISSKFSLPKSAKVAYNLHSVSPLRFQDLKLQGEATRQSPGVTAASFKNRAACFLLTNCYAQTESKAQQQIASSYQQLLLLPISFPLL